MSLQAKEVLKAKVSSLKDGNHSSETAGMIAEQIRKGVELEVITWEELKINSDELDKLLRKFVPVEHVPRVEEFKKFWAEYQAAQDRGDQAAIREALVKIKPVFQGLRKLMLQHVIEPQALMPCSFFELKEALKEESG